MALAQPEPPNAILQNFVETFLLRHLTIPGERTASLVDKRPSIPGNAQSVIRRTGS
jgi:hypothetical protein